MALVSIWSTCANFAEFCGFDIYECGENEVMDWTGLSSRVGTMCLG